MPSSSVKIFLWVKAVRKFCQWVLAHASYLIVAIGIQPAPAVTLFSFLEGTFF